MSGGENRTGPDRRVVLGGVVLSGAMIAAEAADAAASAGPAPVAQTAYGRIRGYNDGPIKVFKGVPYGADTGGANRWLPAKPPKSWTGLRDCTKQGPMCPQPLGAPMAEEAAMLQTGPLNEDCLNLDVFTPAVGAGSGKRPVMVWFHGGGFAAGSGGATSYDGRNLCQKHDVVLVTVTHRLNVFGFLYLADLYGPRYADSGNVGILDCVAALRWVRNNIAGFGGDPANVTIFGQSGGGAKVSTLMGMTPAKGLFHRAIAQSGAEVRAGTPAMGTAIARRVVEAVGAKSIEDLQKVPQEKLLQVNNDLHLFAGPVVDGRSLSANPFDPVASPLSKDIPFMCGTTQNEAVFFPSTPLDPIDDAQLAAMLQGTFRGIPAADVQHMIEVLRKQNPGKPNQFLFQLVASQNFGNDVLVEADRKAEQHGAPVFVYYFAHTVPARGGKLGAPHTGEIPYHFDSLTHSKPLIGPVTAREQALADKLSAAWTSFARKGDPNNPLMPHWTPYDTAKRPIMVLDDHPKIVDDPLHDTRVLLAEVRSKYPPAGPFGPPPPTPPGGGAPRG